ncbi:amino acid ABC transporter substrate-binding protein [Caenimonas sedimenti]|nr:amino acid ABC transporter substrate-binding protein [Caenimonas sedimenti]
MPRTLPRFALRCALAAMLAAPLLAAAGDVMDRIARRDEIIIGHRTESPPFAFLDAAGQPIGYSIDLCRGIAERIRAELGKPRLPIRFVPVPSDQMVRIVSAGNVDLLCAGTSDTEERRQTMAFSIPIFVTNAKFLVRLKDSIGSAKQLKGQSVAVLGRTTAESAVPAYSERTGLDLQISRALTAEAAIGQLDLGQVKAYARDEVLLLSQLAQLKNERDYGVLQDVISTEINAIALPKGDALLQKAVDQGIALMVRSGQAEALYKKWFIDPHVGAPAGLRLRMPAELKEWFDRLR